MYTVWGSMDWVLGWAGIAMKVSRPRTLLKLEGALCSPVIKPVNTTASKPIIHLCLYYNTCTLLFNLPTYSSGHFFSLLRKTHAQELSKPQIPETLLSLLVAESLKIFEKKGCKCSPILLHPFVRLIGVVWRALFLMAKQLNLFIRAFLNFLNHNYLALWTEFPGVSCFFKRWPAVSGWIIARCNCHTYLVAKVKPLLHPLTPLSPVKQKDFNQPPRERRWNLDNRCFNKCALALKGKCKVLVFTPKHSIMFYGTRA